MKDLAKTVDAILSKEFSQQQLILSSDEIADVVEKYEELPSSIIIPKPISSETQSLGKEYYVELKKSARTMLALQLEYERLRRAENSPFNAKIMEYRNVIRNILSQKEINGQNIYHMQVENLANLKDILGLLVGYSRNVLNNFEGYEDKVLVELHLDKSYLKELSSNLPSIESLEKELASEIKEKNFEDDKFVPDFIRYNKLSRLSRRTRHSLDLVKNSVEYLAKEIPLLERLGLIFETSTNDAENIFYMISYYERSLRETEELVFAQIETGKNIGLVNQQMDNLTKTAFEIYKKVGLSAQNISEARVRSLDVYDRSMNELAEHSQLQLAENWSHKLLKEVTGKDGKGK